MKNATQIEGFLYHAMDKVRKYKKLNFDPYHKVVVECVTWLQGTMMILSNSSYAQIKF